MICLKRKKCEKIINHLIQEYHSQHRKEAQNQIGKVSADHISRGFANSTAVVTGKLAVEYDYINKLIDHIFQALEKDFPKLSLKDCKETLINTVEIEYKKLRPMVNTWLMQALMAQQGLIKQFEDRILKKQEETKKNIENRCELSKQKQGQKRWWHNPTNQWIVGIIVIIMIPVIGGIIKYYAGTESPRLGLYFTESAYKGTEIGITGPFGKRIYNIALGLTLTNSAKQTAEDAWLTFETPRDITITSVAPKAEPTIAGSGESAKNRTAILLGAIHQTEFGKLSNCNVELRWSSISSIASLRFGRPFVFNEITNRIEEFVIDGEITAKDMSATKVKLKINIGTREAFKAIGYKGEIFEIKDSNELAKTSL